VFQVNSKKRCCWTSRRMQMWGHWPKKEGSPWGLHFHQPINRTRSARSAIIPYCSLMFLEHEHLAFFARFSAESLRPYTPHPMAGYSCIYSRDCSLKSEFLSPFTHLMLFHNYMTFLSFCWTSFLCLIFVLRERRDKT